MSATNSDRFSWGANNCTSLVIQHSVDDSVVKADFRFDFEVVMSPYNLDGDT